MKKLSIKCIYTFLVLFFLFSINSCSKNDLNESSSTTGTNVLNEYTIKFNGKDIKVVKKGDLYFWFDDVAFDEQTFDSLKALEDSLPTQPRSAYTTDIDNYWPNGIVYYTITTGFSNNDLQMINAALNNWSTNTGITFVSRTNQPNYIKIQKVYNQNYGGESEGIGMLGGQQFLYLNDGQFNTTTIIHEIGHSIGFYHEQSRTDRDNYIIIYTQNIESGELSQFETYAQLGEPGANLGTFDWSSVMLYDSYAFSANNSPTMVRKSDNQPFFTTNNTVLSQGDIVSAKNLYGPPFAKIIYYQDDYSDDADAANETIHIEGHYDIGLFSDAACTIPYTLASPKTVTYYLGDYPSGGNKQLNQITISSGQQALTVASFTSDMVYEYGSLTRDNERGDIAFPGKDGFWR
ncbi:M12 family metallopeptidase [Arachidicoccus ginsenosidimutans]|uniref:M12 family metallopeptidase n=1 Tax=Arachidicoccus sp. BS20 TaxID=1850526 RepID=UPI0018D3189E|nr:M12 family metallopeptidase [Arachidicoccus sp. BS20]